MSCREVQRHAVLPLADGSFHLAPAPLPSLLRLFLRNAHHAMAAPGLDEALEPEEAAGAHEEGATMMRRDARAMWLNGDTVEAMEKFKDRYYRSKLRVPNTPEGRRKARRGTNLCSSGHPVALHCTPGSGPRGAWGAVSDCSLLCVGKGPC